MLAFLAGAVRFIMEAPLVMAPWIMATSMFYLLQKRAHRFRRSGTIRLFATSAIMGVVIPVTTRILGWVFDTQLPDSTKQLTYIGMAPVLIILVFALAVTLVQRFLGADAETALALAWPIVAITYLVPLLIGFILSVFHNPWLTGQATFP
jgi:hypothetical protein